MAVYQVASTIAELPVNGVYEEAGNYLSRPAYKNRDANLLLYWSEEYSAWAIGSDPGDVIYLQAKVADDPKGAYSLPDGTAEDYFICVADYVETSEDITGYLGIGSWPGQILYLNWFTLTNYTGPYSKDPRVFANGNTYLARRSDGFWFLAQGSYDGTSYFIRAYSSAEDPDLVTEWKLASDWSAVVNLGFAPLYGRCIPVEGDLPGVEDDPVIPDYPEVPQEEAKGIIWGDIFIPVCPNPADRGFARVSETGKRRFARWFSAGARSEITLNVVHRATSSGWVTFEGSGEFSLAVYPEGQSELAAGIKANELNGTAKDFLFVPEGFLFEVKNNESLAKAYFLPCRKQG